MFIQNLNETFSSLSQDLMWGGVNEAKVDQTTEMYFLLSDPLIWESSNTWEIVTGKYTVGTKYICRIQLFELSYKGVIITMWNDTSKYCGTNELLLFPFFDFV